MDKSKRCCYINWRISCQYNNTWRTRISKHRFTKFNWYWVGLYQDNTDPDYSEPAGGWKWLDGKKEEKLGSNIWVNNEPNDTGNSNSRGYFYISSNDVRTADRPNSGSYKYIVEFDDGEELLRQVS